MKKRVIFFVAVLCAFCGQVTFAQTAAQPAAQPAEAIPASQTPGGQDGCLLTFIEIDRNKDGVVTRTEWLALCPAAGEKFFRQADTNRDGKVTKKEWQAWQKKHKQPSAATKAKPKSKTNKAKESKETYTVHFVKIDQNRDGTITLEELVVLYPDQGRRIFHEADVNQDGKITHEEWHSWRVKNTPPKQANTR